MKIILFLERRFPYVHDHNVFSFESFRNRGAEIEVWSSVRWQMSGMFQKDYFPLNVESGTWVYYIDGMEALLENLYRIRGEECFFLIYSYHGYNNIGYAIRKEITKRGFEFANLTEPPTVGGGEQPKGFIFSKLEAIRIETAFLLRIMAGFLYLPLCGQKNRGNDWEKIKDMVCRFVGPYFVPSKYNFITGNEAANHIPNLFELYFSFGSNVFVNSNVYNEYWETVSSDQGEDSSEYILYIDQGLLKRDMPFNQDITCGEWDTDKYSKNLDELFSCLEEYYKCPVIIAKHPKSDYKEDRVLGRKLFTGQTPKLIQGAKLVVNQTSTTWGLITLFKKPFINIYNNLLMQRSFNNYRRIREIMDCRQLNLENSDEIKNFKQYIKYYDKKSYDAYLNRFIYGGKGEKQNRNSYDIIADIICNSSQTC